MQIWARVVSPNKTTRHYGSRVVPADKQGWAPPGLGVKDGHQASLANTKVIHTSTMTESVYTGEDFADKVKKQVEFYFSDSNLQSDRFLWRIYEANDGWVELKTLLTFGRMRQFRPAEKVVEALKTSEKLVLSANNDMIRRTAPLKDYNELKNTRKRNSVHIEGFPAGLSQDQVEEWFNTMILPSLPKEQAFCSIRRIRSRSNKEFFGVVDVEFKTLEDAEYFLGVSIAYPQGIVKDGEVDEKEHLKKMSLLTFREMRESGKRFGVNEVTKRRNSFKDNQRKKFRKDEKKDDAEDEKKEEAIEEQKEEVEKKEEVEEKKEQVEEKKEEVEETKAEEK